MALYFETMPKFLHRTNRKTTQKQIIVQVVYILNTGENIYLHFLFFLWKQSNLNNKINHIMTKLQKNIIKVLLIRIILISTIISADIRLFFLFVHDEQNEVLSINNKKLSFTRMWSLLKLFGVYLNFKELVIACR